MKLKQKPSGIWLVEFQGDHGERRRVSTGIKTAPQRVPPPEVKHLARDIVLGVAPAALAPRKAHKPDGQLTMSGLFEKALGTVWAPGEAKSQATILSNVKILNGLTVVSKDPGGSGVRTWIFGDEPIQNITYSALDDVVTALKAKGYAPATIKRKLDMVSKALRMATKWTDSRGQHLLLAKPPMPTIRVSNFKDRVISPAEEEAIFNAIEGRRLDEPGRQWFRFAVLLRFLLDTAARLGEALSISTDLVETLTVKEDGQEKRVTYVTFERYRTKNDKPRKIPLTARVIEGLASLLGHLGRGEGGKRLYFPMTSGTAWYMFNQIREDVKRETGMNLDDVTLHTFRHTTATRLAQGGMDIGRLKEWLGHSDIKITVDRYLHLTPGDLIGGVSILEAPVLPSDPSDSITPANVSVPIMSANRANEGTPRLN